MIIGISTQNVKAIQDDLRKWISGCNLIFPYLKDLCKKKGVRGPKKKKKFNPALKNFKETQFNSTQSNLTQSKSTQPN